MNNGLLTRLKPQKGITLVEILVALAVGILLTAGMIQIFVSNRQAYRVQDGVSRLQENGRFAMTFMRQYISLAGYQADPSAAQRTVFPPDNPIGGFPNVFALPGQIIDGTDDNVNGDSINFRYEGDGDGAIRDCLGGNPPGAGQFVVSSFNLSADNELQCMSFNPAGAAVVQTQPLIDNVENLQILYGIANPNNASAQSYLPAANVAADRWDDIVSVRVSLLLRSAEDNLTTKPQTYTFNGVTVTPSDRRLRQVFTTTVNLRNITR